MTPKKRVLTALAHKESDRVPIDFGGWVTSISKVAYDRLMKYLGMEIEGKISDTMQQIVKVDEAVLRKLGVDVRHIYLNAALQDWQLKEEEEGYIFVDDWGIKWKMPEEHGYYFDMVDHPLKDATIDDLKRYRGPNLCDSSIFERIESEARKLSKQNYAIMLDGGPGLFEYSCWLRGTEEFMVDMISNPEFASTLLEKICELRVEFMEKLLNIVGKYVQIVGEGDDLASQNGLLISPELYRKFIKPYHKKLLSSIRKRTEAYIFFHSCGSIYPLIRDLMEIGVDILNPVQVSAKDMDTKKLKEEFGHRLTFWGGCDTQKILEFGSVNDVKKEVKRRIHDLAPGGGFVFAQVHNIQRRTPSENIIAMFESAREYGKYPIGA